MIMCPPHVPQMSKCLHASVNSGILEIDIN